MGTQRFALCDLALPGPDDSFVGHAVALVVAVSQNPDEFPLAAVRIKAAAEQSEELRCLYQRVRTLPKGYPEIALKFGAVLYEGLFACPLNGGKVEIDFARRRHEMFVLEVPDARAANAPPSVEILLELGAREFPKPVQSSPGWCRPAGGDRRRPRPARAVLRAARNAKGRSARALAWALGCGCGHGPSRCSSSSADRCPCRPVPFSASCSRRSSPLTSERSVSPRLDKRCSSTSSSTGRST